MGLMLGACVPLVAPADSGPVDTAIRNVACPPPPPHGQTLGAHAIDVTVTDCAGTPTSIHGLCGKPALIINWYGWCASCEDNAELARALAAEHSDLSVVIALDEDPLAHAVDSAFCAAYTDAHPTSAATWLDANKALETYGTTDLVLVLAADGTLLFNRETSTVSTITAAVNAALER